MPRTDNTIQKLLGTALALCLSFALAACGVKVDTSAWRYTCFDEAGIAMLLPDDLEQNAAADGLFSAADADVQVELSACGELFADGEALTQWLARDTAREAESVDCGGLTAARLLPAKDDPTLIYALISPDGDTYRIRLAPGEQSKEKRSAAVMNIICESLCRSESVPPEPAPVRVSAAVRTRAVDDLVLVNRRHAIPEGWETAVDLAGTTNAFGEAIKMERTACKAFFALRAALAAQGVYVEAGSAYRSAAEQQALYERIAQRCGADDVKKYVALPGCSEHQTGLALDLLLNIDGAAVRETEDMLRYPELWAKVCARLAEFGFILRYPAGGEYETGCGYEPWHIRYVGEDAAREIAARGITLEEYLGTDPAAIDYLVLVNPQTALPEDWEETVEIVYTTNRHGEDVGVERTAYAAYCSLRDDLAQEGVRLDINSAYRTVASQEALAKSYTQKYGADYVKKYVAVPGYSEHHTGLAIDLYLESVDVWAKIHARLAQHGFILRYPEGAESITGYGYEPWHIRYVGADAAREITERGITLEEYLGKQQDERRPVS